MADYGYYTVRHRINLYNNLMQYILINIISVSFIGVRKMIMSKRIFDIEKSNPYRRLTYRGIVIHMRFKLPIGNESYGFQPDVQCMPIYCKKCNQALSELYCHCSSRYCIVGEVKCDHCGHSILVTDNDNIVNTIKFDGVEIKFNELYKFHWKYLSQMERNKSINIKALFAGDEGHVSIDKVTACLQDATGEIPTGQWQYITDRRFPILPNEINRWIELLELCGVSGIYLDKAVVQ